MVKVWEEALLGSDVYQCLLLSMAITILSCRVVMELTHLPGVCINIELSMIELTLLPVTYMQNCGRWSWLTYLWHTYRIVDDGVDPLTCVKDAELRMMELTLTYLWHTYRIVNDGADPLSLAYINTKLWMMELTHLTVTYIQNWGRWSWPTYLWHTLFFGILIRMRLI